MLGLALSAYVVRLRWRVKSASGDGGDKTLARAIRAHGNFSEYAPFGLVLALAAELAGATQPILHVAGAALLAGRLLHAAAFTFGWRHFQLRAAAMLLTWTSIGVSSIAAATFSLV